MRISIRVWFSCLLLVLMLLTVVSCATAPAGAPPSPMQLTDQLGRAITLDKPPQRIISLAPSNTEIIFALGLADRLVAVTDYDNYPPEAKNKPSIGGYTTPDIERIVALSPDLILATSIHQKTIIPQLEQRGLKVFALAPITLDNILTSFQLVGQVTGQEKETAKLLTGLQNRIKTVTDKTSSLPEDKKPGVFYLTWHDPLKTSGAGTIHQELIQKAGGRNIFAEISGTQSVDLESILARNPQVMIAGVGMGTGGDKTFQYLKTESRLQNTAAWQQDRIYRADMDITGRAGPRIVDGLEFFARCIHPEIFGQAGN